MDIGLEVIVEPMSRAILKINCKDLDQISVIKPPYHENPLNISF